MSLLLLLLFLISYVFQGLELGECIGLLLLLGLSGRFLLFSGAVVLSLYVFRLRNLRLLYFHYLLILKLLLDIIKLFLEVLLLLVSLLKLVSNRLQLLLVILSPSLQLSHPS